MLQIEELISKKVIHVSGLAAPRVSGNLKSHYAPKAKVLLNISPEIGSGYFALREHPTPSGVLRLGSPHDSVEFAKTLYAALRTADTLGLKVVVVRVPESGQMLEALNDRLRKASAIRSED